MRKYTLFLLFICAALPCVSKAADHDPLNDLLSLANIKSIDATQDNISSLLGQPEKIEDKKKQAVWHYTIANSDLEIYWDARTPKMQKIAFTTSISAAQQQAAWDNSLARKLVSGQTAFTDALKLLGTPRNMLIKELNQELHYKYQGNVLNLFFRKGTLVNYTLY